MCTVNFSDLTHHVGVSEADLDQQCSREHLATIAKEIDNWLDYAYLLGLSDQDVNGIRADSMLSYGMQVQTTLGMWQKKNGFKATYRCLVEIFLNEKNVTVANVVCSLIKGTAVVTDKPATPSVPANPLKAISSDSASMVSPPSTMNPIPVAIGTMDEDTKENFEGRLLQETREIEVTFCSCVSQLKRSLERRSVCPSKLGNYLSMIKSITKELKDDTSVPSLLTLIRSELCSAKSIDKVFELITPYFSFFNYDLVQHIVKEFGENGDRENFESYLEKFDKFCKRQAIEVKSVLDGEDSTTTRFKVKVEDDFQHIHTVKTVRSFRAKLCTILGVTEPCLRLVSIENGCILLTFILPVFVVPFIFPLSKEQELMFASEGVLAYVVGDDASQTVTICQKEGVDLIQIETPMSPLTPAVVDPILKETLPPVSVDPVQKETLTSTLTPASVNPIQKESPTSTLTPASVGPIQETLTSTLTPASMGPIQKETLSSTWIPASVGPIQETLTSTLTPASVGPIQKETLTSTLTPASVGPIQKETLTSTLNPASIRKENLIPASVDPIRIETLTSTLTPALVDRILKETLPPVSVDPVQKKTLTSTLTPASVNPIQKESPTSTLTPASVGPIQETLTSTLTPASMGPIQKETLSSTWIPASVGPIQESLTSTLTPASVGPIQIVTLTSTLTPASVGPIQKETLTSTLNTASIRKENLIPASVDPIRIETLTSTLTPASVGPIQKETLTSALIPALVGPIQKETLSSTLTPVSIHKENLIPASVDSIRIETLTSKLTLASTIDPIQETLASPWTPAAPVNPRSETSASRLTPTSMPFPSRGNEEDFGHEQQVAVVTKLFKQRKDVIGVFYSQESEKERAEQIKNSLDHLLSGGNSTVKTYKMGYCWLEIAADDGVTRYVLLGYPPNQRSDLSQNKEVVFLNPHGNQRRRITEVVVIETKSSLVGRSLISLEGFLQMDGNLDNSVLAENILAYFGASQPTAHDIDHAYWSVIPKIIHVCKDRPSLGITVVTREMSAESAFPRITLIKSLLDDCVPELRGQLGRYTHIQSINGYLLDGLNIKDVSAIFKAEVKKNHAQLVVRYVHPKVRTPAQAKLAPTRTVSTPMVTLPEKTSEELPPSTQTSYSHDLSPPNLFASKLLVLTYKPELNMDRSLSRASSGVWSAESVNLHFSDSELSDNLEFSDTELPPAELTQEDNNAVASGLFGAISSKLKHDIPAEMFLKWAKRLSSSEDHWAQVGAKLNLLSTDDIQFLRVNPSPAGNGDKVLRRWYESSIPYKDLVSVLSSPDVRLTALANEIESYFTGSDM